MFGKGLLTGMGITLKRMLGPNITEYYPEVKPKLSPRVRSSMGLIPEKCTACGICATTCPNKVITVTGKKDENNKRVLESYKMDVGRCLFCGLCTEACPQKALLTTQEFENAVYDSEDLQWDMIKRARRLEKEGQA